MTPLIATVFVASLLGSLHCAGMCGPFVAFAVGQPKEGSSRARLQLAYHGGRLATYMLLGAVAGSLGALVDMTSTLTGLQPLAMALAGGLMVAMGVTELLRYLGRRIRTVHPPKWLALTVQRGQRLALSFQPTQRALAIGLLTTLLPCGWLYAFALTAAGTGSPLRGAVVMAVFWIGTLPVLVALGASIQTVLGALGKRLPALCAVALIVVGLTTIAGRLRLDSMALAQSVEAAQSHSQTSVANPDELPPCCRPAANQETIP